MKRILLLLILFTQSVTTNAALFGAKSFEDCVLEKMKGQSANMLYTARAACSTDFPQERELIEGSDYKRGAISASWCDTNGEKVTICLDKNDSEYKLTKLEVGVSKKYCDATNIADIELIKAEKAFIGSKYSAKVKNGFEIKCLYPHWYGIQKK